MRTALTRLLGIDVPLIRRGWGEPPARRSLQQSAMPEDLACSPYPRTISMLFAGRFARCAL
jgi:hypothetical protein